MVLESVYLSQLQYQSKKTHRNYNTQLQHYTTVSVPNLHLLWTIVTTLLLQIIADQPTTSVRNTQVLVRLLGYSQLRLRGNFVLRHIYTTAYRSLCNYNYAHCNYSAIFLTGTVCTHRYVCRMLPQVSTHLSVNTHPPILWIGVVLRVRSHQPHPQASQPFRLFQFTWPMNETGRPGNEARITWLVHVSAHPHFNCVNSKYPQIFFKTTRYNKLQ